MNTERKNKMLLDIKVGCETVRSGYDHTTCWVHPRIGCFAGCEPSYVMTLQKLFVSRSDCFTGLFEMRSKDGSIWTEPKPLTALAPQYSNRGIEVLCDATPQYHYKTNTMLLIGAISSSSNSEDNSGSRTGYSVMGGGDGEWSKWEKLETDGLGTNSICAGSVQWVELENGDILLPVSHLPNNDGRFRVSVLRCRFDGRNLAVVEKGNDLTLSTGRGLYEPSLVEFNGKYLLTIRGDDAGYVAVPENGLNFEPAVEWKFDDGNELGNYNTQQHWLKLKDTLFLVYTRRGVNNDHIFRHRAPLLISQVDADKLRIIRSSEKVVVPERGARLGNFGIVKIDDSQAWVSVAEWMQNDNIGYDVYDACTRFGSDNSVFIGKINIGGD